MTALLLGLIIFLGIHSVRIAAPASRDRMVARLGEGGWKGIYSLLSALGLVLIVWGYGDAWANGPILYEPPVWMKHVTALLMLFAFVAIAAYALPSGRIKAALKHPMLVAVKIWALAHLLANGELAAVILFGSILAWAVADRISVKRRGVPVPRAGPVINDVLAVLLGLVLYGAFVGGLHLWLFGVSPIATN